LEKAIVISPELGVLLTSRPLCFKINKEVMEKDFREEFNKIRSKIYLYSGRKNSGQVCLKKNMTARVAIQKAELL
jgi:hypothetical protein